MKKTHLFLVVLLSLSTALIVSLLMAGGSQSGPKETAFERILRTGTIRCGYYVFPPATIRDPNTGEMSGFSVDFMKALSEKTGLKFEWTEEITFGNWPPALQAKRFDVLCTPLWVDLPMLKIAAFTEPLFYAGISPLVRLDDDRFKDDLSRINQPDVTIVTQEGNMVDRMAREIFPKAKFFALPSTADASDYHQSILTKKADVVLLDRNGYAQFSKTNGKTLKLVAPDKPVKLQSLPLVVGRDEMLLKDLLDQTIREMQWNGDIDRILRKWEAEPGLTYLRAAPVFAPPPPESAR